MNQADLIWMNGQFVDWEDAKVHVLTHGLHYGTGVFEGIRAYETELGTAIFRHGDHLDRLRRSAELYYMPVPYEIEEIRAATHELIVRNGLRSCYIRPLVYRGYGQMGLYPLDAPVDVVIAVWEWGSYLGEEGKREGIRAKVSSWRRISNQSLIPHSKASGQYLNSVLAKIESSKAGYEEAILLDEHGYVCEGSGENIFVVRDGHIVTPPQTDGILDGINRKSLIQIARDLGYEVTERSVGAGRALPGRRGLHDRHGRRARAGARDRRPRRSPPGGRARSRAASRRSSRTPCTGAPSATASGSTWCRCRLRRRGAGVSAPLSCGRIPGAA